MTVASDASRNDYVGTGTTPDYDYTFRIFAATDLLVAKVPSGSLVETELVYLTDYTVTGVGSFAGGKITLTAGNLPSGDKLTIRFRTSLTQGTDIRNQSGFFPEVIEDALDRLTKIDQQQQDEVDRSVKLPETETGDMRLPTVTERAGRFFGFNAEGGPIAGDALSSATPATAFAQTLLDDSTAGEFVETVRGGLAAETTVANDDEVILRDTSATTGKRIAVGNLMKAITGLTAETAPDAADEMAIYDTSAATADKVTFSVLAEAIRALVVAKSGAGGAENYALSASVAADALTITLTGATAVLSATNKAAFTFSSDTAATGSPTTVDATADLTLTISSGSTLGTTSGVAARLWVVVFNDAGTLRLGVVNCSTSSRVYPLADDTLASSVAEGGAGAADSAGVIYTGTAVTAKAMRVLGYLEISEATAGTWATAHTKLRLWQPGMKLPGDTVQVGRTNYTGVATGTTVVPADDSIPQNTEGDEYMSQALVPTSAVNLLRPEFSAQLTSSAAAVVMQASIFRGATANALATYASEVHNAGVPSTVVGGALVAAGSTASTTFKVRAGASAAGTTTFNGSGGARRYGGAAGSFISVTEIMA